MSLALCQNTDDNNNNNNNQAQMNEAAEGGDVTIYRLCAPIASLDCMEEFSGNTGLDLSMGRSISLGSKTSLKNVSSTPGLRYKNIGKSGLRVSNVALGTWSVFTNGVTEEQAETIIKLAYESGINLFDLSDLHSGPRAEIEMGNILKKMNWKRMTYVVSVKIYWSSKGEERGLSRKHIIESVQASLKRLQLDYIDCVLVHKADSMCPMEEVVRAMNYCIEKGWVQYWGTSKWSTTEIMEAYTNCREFNCVTPILEQSEYHMFCRDRAELYLPEMYNKIGVGMMAWGPLSMYLTENTERLFFSKGSLRSKTQNSSWTEDEVAKEDRVEEAKRHLERVRDLNLLAEKLGCSLTQLSIAWTLKHEPVQCLLISAKTTEQLTQSLQALQLLPRLSVAVMLEIERIIENKPVRPPMISTLQMRGLISHDGLAEIDQPESIHDEEQAIVEEQKDEDGRKFTKKNIKRLDDPSLNLSTTKIDEEDQMQIIPLSSPMKVRSPLSYQSSHNLTENSNRNESNIQSKIPSKIALVHFPVPNIKTISHPLPETSSHEVLRKNSILSLKSLSMSLRLLKKGVRSDSLEHVESTTLETIEENNQPRKSIFQMDMFERNLKKFVSKSNEADFHTYSEYQQQQQTPKKTQKSIFKNQKIYDRRSSASDIHEANTQPKNLQHNSGMSTSSSNVKHDKKHHKDEHKSQKSEKDKTAEMLKEVRKRNLETAKRITAPRRISTAY